MQRLLLLLQTHSYHHVLLITTHLNQVPLLNPTTSSSPKLFHTFCFSMSLTPPASCLHQTFWTTSSTEAGFVLIMLLLKVTSLLWILSLYNHSTSSFMLRNIWLLLHIHNFAIFHVDPSIKVSSLTGKLLTLWYCCHQGCPILLSYSGMWSITIRLHTNIWLLWTTMNINDSLWSDHNSLWITNKQ